MKALITTALLFALIGCLLAAVATILLSPVNLATAESAMAWLIAACVSGIVLVGVST